MGPSVKRFLIIALLFVAATLPAQVQWVNAPVGLPQGTLSTPVIRIPRASVNTFHTTEVTLVAGQTNVILIPRFLIVKKEAGAYTVGGIGSNGLMLGYGTVSDNIPAFPWGSSPAFSLLVAAGVDYQFAQGLLHNGAAAGLPFGLSPGPLSGIVGKKLAMRTVAASPGGSGGDLLVKLWYDAVPLAVFDLN